MATNTVQHPGTRPETDFVPRADVSAHAGAPGDGFGNGQPSFQWNATDLRDGQRTTVGIEFDGRNLFVLGADMRRKPHPVINQVMRLTSADPLAAESLAARLRAFVGNRQTDVHLVLSTPRAIVRHFLIPPVRVSQRDSAALWEGQKLIPFPLKDGQALYGVQYTAVDERGWMATLIAVPIEDVQPLLNAVAALRWHLSSVSVAGAQPPSPETSAVSIAEVAAVIAWSRERGFFAVTRGRQLIFHYDLGPMPSLPAGLAEGVTERSLPLWQRWIDSIGVAVGDALDFHLNINPNIPPTRLHIYGLRPEMAPLLTEWQTRFPAGVSLGDPLEGWHDQLPDGVSDWLTVHAGLAAPVLAVLRVPVGIDLTPRPIRTARVQRKRERVARSVFALCAVVAIGWSGFLWSGIAGHRGVAQQSRAQLEQLQRSPVSSRLEYTLAGIAANRRMAQTLAQPGEPWMPWAKSVLAELPPNAALRRFDLVYRGDRQVVVAEVEGTLAPGTAPYALTYREWFDRLRPLCAAAPLLVSERLVGVEGAESSAFTIELIMPAARRNAGGMP